MRDFSDFISVTEYHNAWNLDQPITVSPAYSGTKNNWNISVTQYSTCYFLFLLSVTQLWCNTVFIAEMHSHIDNNRTSYKQSKHM